jgi:hypothetical protein
MKIKFKSEIIEINSIDELYLYTQKKLVNNLKYPAKLEEISTYFIENKDNIIKNKNLIKSITAIFYSKTILNNKYWLDRGYDIEEASLIIKEEQLKRANLAAAKMNKLKEENPEEYYKKQNTSIEFYLNKGLSIEEAQKALTERQTMNTLDWQIKHHGLEEGTKIWNKRISSWHSKVWADGIKYNHDSKSIDLFKNKYGDEWTKFFIDKNTYSEMMRDSLVYITENKLSFKDF